MTTDTLVVDLGNSRIKWSAVVAGSLTDVHRYAHRQHLLGDLLDKYWLPMNRPKRLYVSSVAGAELNASLVNWVNSHWNTQPVFLQTRKSTAGVCCAYDNVSHLGVDRWAAVVAGYNLYQCAVCVVDCGTAITIDATDHQGQHLGGFIVPGLNMMANSILDNTDIKASLVDDTSAFWGIDTGFAIQLGSRRAAAGLIEQAINELTVSHGGRPRLIYTGGDALEIKDIVAIEGEYRADLVLEGALILGQELNI